MRKYTFKGKIIIVTGASSGIGEALSREFAKNGGKVILAARGEQKLTLIANELTEKGYEVFTCVTDVSRETECENLIKTTVEKYGRIDILVNNAGISMKALFHNANISVIRKLMDVNFWGTVYCTRYALPHIIESKGSLVSVSSVAGFHGLPSRSGYSASKFAINGLMESVRIENLKSGLHVMVAAPGFTASAIRQNALLADGIEHGESAVDESRFMSAERVARLILNGIRKRKRNMILSMEGRLTALLQRIVPGIVDRAFYHKFLKEPDSPLK